MVHSVNLPVAIPLNNVLIRLSAYSPKQKNRFFFKTSLPVLIRGAFIEIRMMPKMGPATFYLQLLFF